MGIITKTKFATCTDGSTHLLCGGGTILVKPGHIAMGREPQCGANLEDCC